MYENINVKTVLIEITNKCNLKCMHCYNCFDRGSEKHIYMTIPQIISIIEKCQFHNLNKLYISGGEPLCHPQFLEIIQLCKLYPHILFTITTNGLLLSDEIVKEIEDNENICLQISVDGLNKEIYEAHRGEKTFKCFINNLNKLINSKIKFLTARTCVTKLNYCEVPYIYKYLLENKIMPSFLFVNQMGNAEKNWDKLSLSMANKLKVLDDIISLNQQYNQNITPPEPVSTCNFTENIEVKSLLIKFDGNVAPCQYFYSDSIGNIFKQEIEDILNYKNLKKYYELAAQRKKILSNSPICTNCKIKSICSFGCLGLAKLNNCSLGLDGECSFRIMTCAMYSNGMISIPER